VRGVIRSTVAHVDLAALQANFKAIQEFLKAGPADPKGLRRSVPRVIAVVKANAYGHGSERVALALEAAGADLLACADIEEAIVLRRAGVRAPILVFGALSVSDLDGLFEFSLTPTISTPSAVRAVQGAAGRHKKAIGYHLKIDTGMNRLGFRHDNLRRTLPELLASNTLRLEAIYTHFATADEPDTPYFDQQRQNFETALTVIDELRGGEKRPSIHAANSAATLRLPESHFDAVRCGGAIYGLSPFNSDPTDDVLEPVLSWQSFLAQVKQLQPGQSTGYGRRFVAEEPTWIGIVPVGYADGFQRTLTGTEVRVGGEPRPVVGTVSMDSFAVQLDRELPVGTPVVLLGHGMLAETHARVAGTINYDLLSGIESGPLRARRTVIDA